MFHRGSAGQSLSPERQICSCTFCVKRIMRHARLSTGGHALVGSRAWDPNYLMTGACAAMRL
eukprot:4706585-Pyramimonas_sp.AAC.1